MVIADALMAFVISSFLGILGHRFKVVSTSGLAITIFIGTAVSILGGLECFYLVVFSFIVSGILSMYGTALKRQRSGRAQGFPRNVWQGLAHGLPFLLILLFDVFLDHRLAFRYAFISAVAASNADTWAVEIGLLSKKRPRLITSPQRKVNPGVSGGVTLLGEIAAVVGSSFTILVAILLRMPFAQNAFSILVLPFSALIGEHIDSLLGATLQARYYCLICRKLTEKKIHGCGNECRLLGGWKIVNNEAVNFIAISCAAICAFYLSVLAF